MKTFTLSEKFTGRFYERRRVNGWTPLTAAIMQQTVGWYISRHTASWSAS